MSEFQQEIQARLESARQSLAEAEREGDDYLVRVHLGELESLQHLANENTGEQRIVDVRDIDSEEAVSR